jgi:hypothetical protein
MLSELNEEMVFEHHVQLTGLIPGTIYHYKALSCDRAGNLEESEEYTFTTLGTPATFTVTGLNIAQAEVYVGEAVPVTVLVSNAGNAAGDYEVVLKIDGEVVATKEITGLAGGASQEVTFNAVRESAGVFTVDINGATGSFVVKEALTAELALAGIYPVYDTETHQLSFAKLIYQVDGSSEPMADVELMLKVSLDGELIEEVSLLSVSNIGEEGAAGILDYMPSEGWQSGTYAFEAELYTGGELYAVVMEEMEVTADTEAGEVSWAILGMIIGAALFAIAGTMFYILRRRRIIFGA